METETWLLVCEKCSHEWLGREESCCPRCRGDGDIHPDADDDFPHGSSEYENKPTHISCEQCENAATRFVVWGLAQLTHRWAHGLSDGGRVDICDDDASEDLWGISSYWDGYLCETCEAY